MGKAPKSELESELKVADIMSMYEHAGNVCFMSPLQEADDQSLIPLILNKSPFGIDVLSYHISALSYLPLYFVTFVDQPEQITGYSTVKFLTDDKDDLLVHFPN